MRISFQGRTTATPEAILQGFMHHARAHDLAVESTQDGIAFDVPGPFSQMNFAPYQLVDDGVFRVYSSKCGCLKVSYLIRSYRIWTILLFFLVVSIAMRYPWFVFIGLCCMAILYLYLTHYIIFRRLVSGSNNSEQVTE